MSSKLNDMALLVPAFRERVELLLERLRARGHQPVVNETLRSRERAAYLAEQKGTGIADSMHIYGVAADLICKRHGFDCAKKGCQFFKVLGAEAEAVGLVWGGRWKRVDMPHVQGVLVEHQAAFRKIGQSTARAVAAVKRDDFVRKRLRPVQD